MKIKTFFIVLAAIMTLSFSACCSDCNKPLTGTVWHLVEMNSESVALPEDSFNLIFAEDMTIGGVAACNRLLGNYTLQENNTLKFGAIGTTMMLCPEYGEYENTFTAALGEVASYQIKGDTLTLLDKNGNAKALFTALAAE